MRNSIWVLLFLASTACMQSRKGIKGTQEKWIWGAVDMCDTYPDCDEYAATHLISQLHFDENLIEFKVERLPSEFNLRELASDESISYRMLAKRDGQGSWNKKNLMNRYSIYDNRRIGLSENMNLIEDEVLIFKPQSSYIEKYNRWILERVVTKAGVTQDYGLGERLLDITITYSELENE